MDPFQNVAEVPDLSGQVTPLSYRPDFIGPYSCVYRGRLRHNGELVAIKVINAVDGAALHTMRRKLNRERRTWGALNHPNILPLYGFADDEEMFQPLGALISPWLQRGDSTRFLAEQGNSLSMEDRINLWRDVLAGVEYLHSYQPLLVHGDLKPRNILVDAFGRAQICDFGLVRIFIGESGTGMTTTTNHTGTERYLAYELVLAGEAASPTTASDIYAIGCIGLEFIFSQIPYSNRKSNIGGVIYVDIRAGIPPAERRLLPNSFLEALWTILELCWDRNGPDRPSAAQTIELIEEEIRLYLGASVTRDPGEELAFDDQTQLVQRTERKQGEDNGEDLRAATETGLREAHAPQPSAPVVDPVVTNTGGYIFPVAMLPPFDSAPMKSRAIINQTVTEAQTYGMHGPHVDDLYRRATASQPNLTRSLDDAKPKAKPKAQLLPKMHEKPPHTAKQSDDPFTAQSTQASRRQQTLSQSSYPQYDPYQQPQQPFQRPRQQWAPQATPTSPYQGAYAAEQNWAQNSDEPTISEALRNTPNSPRISSPQEPNFRTPALKPFGSGTPLNNLARIHRNILDLVTPWVGPAARDGARAPDPDQRRRRHREQLSGSLQDAATATTPRKAPKVPRPAYRASQRSASSLGS